MSFFSDTPEFVGEKGTSFAGKTRRNSAFQDLDLDLLLRKFAKKSFFLLVARPFSRCALKIMRATSLTMIGGAAGGAIALLCFAIFLQFGSIENMILSSWIQSRFEKLLPDSDLSMKSATLWWNPAAGAIEIALNRVRADDLSIGKVSLLPDYAKTFARQRLTLKTVSIMNPKINVDIENDLKSVSINPNFEKGGDSRELFEPLGSFDSLGNLLEDGVVIKLINANVSISEGGALWKFKNAYCEHRIGDKFPRTIECSVLFPGQWRVSNISLNKFAVGGKTVYDVKLESLNPLAITSSLNKRNAPIDYRLFSFIEGYNLPISGKITLDFDDSKLLSGKFDLVGSAGSIKLPTKNTLALNLGKKVDRASISGTFTEAGAAIDSINVFYGNSGVQLTGINVPLEDFKFLDLVNVDGTLSLTNIDVNEMESILPETICRSAGATFKNYLPGFRLKLFKTDIKGPIAFGDRAVGENMTVGKSVFQIKDAKIPLGQHVVKNIDASGTVSDDGFDIKLSNAVFEKIKINNGTFFISNKDNSWIGKINADVPINDISRYAQDISPKLASLPIEKMRIKGRANFDMKIARIEGDREAKKSPFRIVEGEGVVQSDNNTKELRIFWNDEKLIASGDVVTGKNKINVKLNEDFASSSGVGEFAFVSNSDFLDAMIPGFSQICDGDYVLKINSSWKEKFEEYDVDLNLKDAAMTIPMLGDIKLKKDDGRFVAHVSNADGNYEFSKMSLDTKNKKIAGRMTLDRNGNLLKCSLDEFEVDKSSAKINILRENDGNVLCSAVGDCLELGKASSILDRVDRNKTISVYMNLKEAIFSNSHKIRNTKGSLDIRGGKIVGGACYAVIGDDTTLALTAKDVSGTNDVLLTLSASNAGEFFKYMGITDTISGGNLNIVTKSSKDSNQSSSGAFEIGDFIVKNNSQLTKLVSLSSSAWLPGSENITVGFNFCSGNFAIANNEIIIENGRAIGPTIAVSLKGSYDRMKDDLILSGVSLPLAAILNNQNMNGALAANYNVAGSIAAPAISVKPLQFVGSDTLRKTFGDMLPLLANPAGNINYDVAPLENAVDPFAQKAFDKPAEAEQASSSSAPQKPIPQRSDVDNRFGIKIVRGKGRG
ncbi:MAG: AsmA-like C-terminal region-containing protein [Holosporaceae bacterium]|jgi:hypothetical protein|nr:AsmA-like C-terminal region-containing protein [Holosporaceae bacterium]